MDAVQIITFAVLTHGNQGRYELELGPTTPKKKKIKSKDFKNVALQTVLKDVYSRSPNGQRYPATACCYRGLL